MFLIGIPCILADIIFEVKDKPHRLFKRAGVDLVYEPKISLLEVSTHYTLTPDT